LTGLGDERPRTEAKRPTLRRVTVPQQFETLESMVVSIPISGQPEPVARSLVNLIVWSSRSSSLGSGLRPWPGSTHGRLSRLRTRGTSRACAARELRLICPRPTPVDRPVTDRVTGMGERKRVMNCGRAAFSSGRSW